MYVQEGVGMMERGKQMSGLQNEGEDGMRATALRGSVRESVNWVEGAFAGMEWSVTYHQSDA